MKNFACIIALALVAGCGRSYPETVQVSGKVTYDGRPVPTGRVCFWPEDGRPAIGEIQSDGTYSLTSFIRGDGALEATHRVSIKATEVQLPAGYNEHDVLGDARPTIKWLIPQRYERPETSGLTATVKRGKNVIDFNLPAQR